MKVFVGFLFFVSALSSCFAAAPPAGSASGDGSTQVRTSENEEPPFDLGDKARIAAGANRFNANCAAYCHGKEGSGGKVPPFKGRQNADPREFFKTITNGRRGADVMPAWGAGFSSEKRWELVAYIMYLTKLPAD